MTRTSRPVPAIVGSLVTVIAALVPGAAAMTQQPAPAGEMQVQQNPLDEALRGFASRLVLDGAGLAAGVGEHALHRTAVGNVTVDSVVPIASASKWLAVATVLTLVDDGTLDLDVPVKRYLPEFDHPDRELLTLRLCLTCTAGFPVRLPAANDKHIDMDGLAKALAAVAMEHEPGLDFRYGGLGFQVAACAAVRVTGKDWHALFDERIAGPLGLEHTAFGRLTPLGAEAGTTKAPWVAGGAVSTLGDYERFVGMLAQGGEFEGHRVLRATTVERMLHSYTDGKTVRFAGFDGDLGYGFGTWLQRLPGGLVRASDPGALGFLPWIDLDDSTRGHTWGVLAVQDSIARVLPRVGALQSKVRDFAASPVVAGRDENVQFEHDGRTRRYLLHVPPGADQANALPLLLVLHGGGGNARQIADSTGFSRLADREHFAVVYPEGTGRLRTLLTWNSGGLPVYAQDANVDDVGFLRAVVDDVKRRVAVDPDRISATGMSNGAMMCHRLARAAADLFCAIVPVSGAMNFTEQDADSPIDVMIVHGTADEHVRFDGGKPERSAGRAGNRVDASVKDAVDYYRARDGLAGEPAVTTEGDGKVHIENWTRSSNGVRLSVVTLDGGGHAWPGGRRGVYPGADEPFAWDATAAIWQFCSEAKRRNKD